jgi:putative membrane protein
MDEKPDIGKEQDTEGHCDRAGASAVERWFCAAGRLIGWILSEVRTGLADIRTAVTETASDARRGRYSGPELSPNTRLSLQRSYLACERTMMAWVRTALSMISFGFTIGKFFEYVQTSRKEDSLKTLSGKSVSPDTLGLLLVFLGIAALAAASVAHARDVRRLEEEGLPHHRSLSLMGAIAIVLIGLFAFTVLALNL